MKVNTISLNSVRLNTIAPNHIGEIRSGGGGSKPSPIPQWIREHISFYYDMSKPMDVYPDDFSKWTKSADCTFNVTSTNITITNFKNLKATSVYLAAKSNFKGMKIRVSGLVDGQELYWGYWNNSILRIPSNGDYTLAPIEQTAENLGVRSGNIVGDCNITIEMLPSGTSVPTNEILKVSGYLQDLSGRKRNMKLTNFLFDMMSGVDGYNNEAFNKSVGSSLKWELIDSRTIKGKASQVFTDFGYYHIKDVTNNVMHINWHIDGIQEGNKVYLTQYTYNNFKIELHNGDNHVALDVSESTDRPNYFYVSVISDQPYSTDITITQIPEYPGALVTDGVDDYGLVENLSSGVKMLFMTVNPIGDYNSRKDYYSQIKKYGDDFRVIAYPNDIAYNYENPNNVTYINGVLNKSIYPEELFDIKHTFTIVNNAVPLSEDRTCVFFRYNLGGDYYSRIAFYNSIAFDSIPTEADGFTEQELIDYVLTNIIGQ